MRCELRGVRGHSLSSRHYRCSRRRTPPTWTSFPTSPLRRRLLRRPRFLLVASLRLPSSSSSSSSSVVVTAATLFLMLVNGRRLESADRPTDRSMDRWRANLPFPFLDCVRRPVVLGSTLIPLWRRELITFPSLSFFLVALFLSYFFLLFPVENSRSICPLFG